VALPPHPVQVMHPSLVLLANQLATTVTTFPPGDPKLATSDPSNTTGLVMVILLNLLIVGGGVVLFLYYRRRLRTNALETAGTESPATTSGPTSD
jgi:hypothetical protein